MRGRKTTSSSNSISQGEALNTAACSGSGSRPHQIGLSENRPHAEQPWYGFAVGWDVGGNDDLI